MITVGRAPETSS